MRTTPTPFGQWLFETRNARGLTQKQVGGGRSPSTISNIERGATSLDAVSDAMLRKIAVGLGLSADVVFEAAGRPLPPWAQEQDSSLAASSSDVVRQIAEDLRAAADLLLSLVAERTE